MPNDLHHLPVAQLETVQPTSNILTRFESWILAGASDEQRADPAHRERVRNVGIGTVVATAGFLGEAIEGVRIGVPVVLFSGLIVAALFVSTILFLRKTQRFSLAGHAVLCGVYLATCSNLLFTGGFSNPAIVALFILPIGAAILIDVRASLGWGAIALFSFIAFWIAPRVGIHTGELPGGIDGFNSLLNRSIVLCGIVVMISLFVAGQKQAEERIHQAIASLEGQAAHLVLLNEAAVAANQSATLQEAIFKCLERTCKIKSWPLALAYERLATEELTAERAVLYAADTVADKDQRLVRESFQLLVDMPADDTESLETPSPSVHWDQDLMASDNPYRKVLAEQLGLRSRVLIEVVIGDQKWVMEFFSMSKLEPDDAFAATIRSTGTQLGRVLERSRSHSRIHDLSYTDSLTRLSNRRHLKEDIDALVADSAEGEHVAVMQIGLDRFKTINDALGHHVGDALLRTVASHLVELVSELAAEENTTWNARECVFRIGGDEFAVVLSGITVPARASLFADRILDRISQPINVKDREIHSRASIGIGISTLDASNGQALLQCADAALAAAKKSGGAKVCHYAASLNQESNRRLFLENHLRRAISRDELALAYQPLMLAAGKEIAGVEALLRWTTKGGERVSPVDFIPVAESTGQIGVIGRWVLKTACVQLAQWILKKNGPTRIAVNVSVVQLRETDFVEFVEGLIAEHKLPTGSLELEITESRLIGSEPEVLLRLEQLQAAGTKLSLDDFGTGYSSLSQLKRLPIAKLKIDRSFVDGIENDGSNMALVEAIVQIGKNLGLTIVAEGVENEEQAEILRTVGANELQGFHYSRPVPAVEVEDLFAKQIAPVRETALLDHSGTKENPVAAAGSGV